MCAVTNGLARWRRRQPYRLTALIGFQCRNVDHLRHCSSRQSYGFVGQTIVALQPCRYRDPSWGSAGGSFMLMAAVCPSCGVILRKSAPKEAGLLACQPILLPPGPLYWYRQTVKVGSIRPRLHPWHNDGDDQQ